MTDEAIAALLQPYLGSEAAPAADWAGICSQLAVYLDLILKWNAKLNLTAIRTPDEIVRRHFGESLFAGAHLGPCANLLDFGSGAGFPGLPIQLLRPDVAVTLAESHGKKAAFLQEVVRTLRIPTEVYAARVEAMPSDRCFDTVTLRAVDNMEDAVRAASQRASSQLLILGSSAADFSSALEPEFQLTAQIPVPATAGVVLQSFTRR